MEEVVKWLLEWAKDSPFLVFLIAFCALAISHGPAYIRAISEVRSRKRHDDVLLSEKEHRLQQRIEDRKRKVQ